MNDSLGVEVVQTVEDLSSEGLYQILAEPSVAAQEAGNRTTRNIFKEAIKSLSTVRQ
jgi:hypothetical protein